MKLVNPGVLDNSITIAKLAYLFRLSLANQNGNIAPTNWIANPVAGLYRITSSIVLTQAATTSSTLPGLLILWTDLDTSAASFFNLTDVNTNNGLGAEGKMVPVNTTNAPFTYMINAKAGVAIQYQTTGYASLGATPMLYSLRLLAEGPF